MKIDWCRVRDGVHICVVPWGVSNHSTAYVCSQSETGLRVMLFNERWTAGTATFSRASESVPTRDRTPEIRAVSRVLVFCRHDERNFRGGEGSGLL